jgi:periplasmic protein CpxP/Spy
VNKGRTRRLPRIIDTPSTQVILMTATPTTVSPRRFGPLTVATLLVALTGATATLSQAQPMPGMGMGMGGMPAMHQMRGAPGMMLPERALDAIGATAEQKARVRGIFQAAMDDQRKLREANPDLHQQMMQLMAAPQVDPAAAEALRQKHLAQHDAASKRMLQALLDAQAVLTPEQRGKLAEHMKTRQDMMQRHHRERQSMDAPRG